MSPPSDLPSEKTVRAEVRAWLEQHWRPDRSLIEWRNKLADTGWAMPAWPAAWHGRGYPPELVLVVEQEFARAGAVGPARAGIRLLAAATLLEHGTDAQKENYLRRIVTGEDTWCQLFSEPGSGSDLAGSTTRAEPVDDGWVVNGQKVWTTSAHHADWGLLLARTDWNAPKHGGLTYFVLDMHQPGVEVRPIRQMNGYASFNQVFMNDARIAAGDRIGEVGGGWAVAMTTLAHERRGADGLRSGPSRSAGAPKRKGRIYEEEAEEVATAMAPYVWYPQRAGRVDLAVPRALATGRITDPAVRQELAKLLILAGSAEWTARRARAARKAGMPEGPEGSLGKLAASQVARQAARVHTLIADEDALYVGGDAPEGGLIAEILLSVPAVSIAGGTDEIQRNIIAERVLGMPRETRFDKGPFRDIPVN